MAKEAKDGVDSNDLFDEYARRQFVAKDPNYNPFGRDETPARFDEFDVFTKVRLATRAVYPSINAVHQTLTQDRFECFSG